MKSRFSLLLLSVLVAAGCVHDEYFTKSAQHFGEIKAAYTGKTTAQECSITTDLESLKQCEYVERDCKGGNHLLDCLFGETRQTKFANYIVYFDQRHTPGTFRHHPSILMWNQKNTRYVYGAQQVFILLFTEYKACFTAYITTLTKSQPNPFDVLNLVNKGVAPVSKDAGLQTRPAEFSWYPLSGDPDNPVMWLAIAPATVDINTADWITVRFMQPKPKSDKTTLPDECIVDPQAPAVAYKGNFLAYNAFFSNNRESRVAVSLAFATTFTNREVSPPNGRSNPYANAYAFTKIYTRRPKLVSNRNKTGGSIAYRQSLAIALGTNVTNSPLRELLLGVSVGHLAGNVGFIAGMNYFTPNDATTTGRRHRPFIAIDYSF